MGAVGVTGTSAANRLAEEADVVLAVGTRLQDFTTGSWALFKNAGKTIIGLNVQPFDAGKHRALPLVADAPKGSTELRRGAGRLEGAGRAGPTMRQEARRNGRRDAAKVTAATNAALPSDAQVIGAVQRAMGSGVTLLLPPAACRANCTSSGRRARRAATTPNTASRPWATRSPAGSASRWRKPDEEVVVMVGDGSYLMLNSEIATSVMLGLKLTIVLLDNRGYGCINRLQMATGGANFNNLLKDARHEVLPDIDFAAHAASLGAVAREGAVDRRAGNGAGARRSRTTAPR